MTYYYNFDDLRSRWRAKSIIRTLDTNFFGQIVLVTFADGGAPADSIKPPRNSSTTTVHYCNNDAQQPGDPVTPETVSLHHPHHPLQPPGLTSGPPSQESVQVPFNYIHFFSCHRHHRVHCTEFFDLFPCVSLQFACTAVFRRSNHVNFHRKWVCDLGQNFRFQKLFCACIRISIAGNRREIITLCGQRWGIARGEGGGVDARMWRRTYIMVHISIGRRVLALYRCFFFSFYYTVCGK